MRISRLEFGIAKGTSMWAAYTGSCGCRIVDLGPFYITWLAKDCKCAACKKYECECGE